LHDVRHRCERPLLGARRHGLERWTLASKGYLGRCEALLDRARDGRDARHTREKAGLLRGRRGRGREGAASGVGGLRGLRLRTQSCEGHTQGRIRRFAVCLRSSARLRCLDWRQGCPGRDVSRCKSAETKRRALEKESYLCLKSIPVDIKGI